jgi:hypothetical protein
MASNPLSVTSATNAPDILRDMVTPFTPYGGFPKPTTVAALRPSEYGSSDPFTTSEHEP